MFSLVIKKLKAFRMTPISLALLVLASYRTVTSGESIQLVGICAAVVPFFSQFKKFPRAEEVTEVQDVLSSYILNFVLMFIYLAWVLLLTWIGSNFIPSYVVNPNFLDMLCIALCADVVFISAVIPICRDLKPMQRMIPGLILTNAMLVFMMMAANYLKVSNPGNIPIIAAGFCGLILVLTFSLIAAGSRKQKG